MSTAKFNTAEEAKNSKWFSRRHQTTEGHRMAQEKYLSEHDTEARQRKAEEREIAREARTPWQQIALLDKRLGAGQGARKERARLQAIIKGPAA